MSGLLRLLDIDDSADLHPLLYTQETSPLRAAPAAPPPPRRGSVTGTQGAAAVAATSDDSPRDSLSALVEPRRSEPVAFQACAMQLYAT